MKIRTKLILGIFLFNISFAKIFAMENPSELNEKNLLNSIWKFEIKNSLNIEKFPGTITSDIDYNTKSFTLVKLDNNTRINSNIEFEIGLNEEIFSFSGNIKDKLTDKQNPDFPFFRRFNLSKVQIEKENLNLKGEINLLNLNFNYGKYNTIIGRQIILWEHTFFWNPTNWLGTIERGTISNKNKLNCSDGLCSMVNNASENYFDPNRLQQNNKCSVDAVRFSFTSSILKKFEIISAFGQEDTKFKDIEIIKTYFNLNNLDLNILLGKMKNENRFGLELNKNFDKIEIMSDLSYTYPVNNENPFALCSAGTGYKFSNLSKINVELYYNGYGEDDIEKYGKKIKDEKIVSGEINNISKYYLGMRYKHEFNKHWYTELSFINNLIDKSNLSGMQLTYSVSNNVKFISGALIASGKKSQINLLRSEFGTYPDNYYLQYEIIFF